MSRSYYRNGWTGFSHSGNMKQWKKRAHKRLRQNPEATRLREVSNIYDAPGDKYYFVGNPLADFIKRK